MSAPLLEDLRVTDKVSQNLHAELLLRAVGRARRNVGSFEAGFEEMKAFLAEAGIAPEAYNFRDGSGLARLNLVTPATVIKLLRYMYAGAAARGVAFDAAGGGQDGTLSYRFGDTPGRRPGLCEDRFALARERAFGYIRSATTGVGGVFDPGEQLQRPYGRGAWRHGPHL